MTLHRSPSENHRRLMAEITPRFAAEDAWPEMRNLLDSL